MKSALPEYKSWAQMKRRCYDSKHQNYPYYGGRGIRVCARWLKSFDAFLKDMGNKPKGATIDRVDNGGNYCPKNCCWETSHSEQMRNRRNTVWVNHHGRKMTLTEFARDFCKVSRQALCNMRAKGWSVKMIVRKYAVK